MTDHPDTDLTDPHGEAEALRRENERLRSDLRHVITERDKMFHLMLTRAEAAEAMEAEFAAIMRHLGGVPFMRSMMEAQRNANGAYILYEDGSAIIKVNSDAKVSPVNIPVPVAANRAPDPVVNAGSCQPGDLISRAAVIEVSASIADRQCPDNMPHNAYMAYHSGAMDVLDAIRALPAAPVAEALTPQPDWKAMAERLGEAGGKLDKAASEVIARGAQTGPQWSRLTAASLHFRAALSDLAKMKGE